MIRNPNLPLYEALIIPNEALQQGGIEVLRAGIVKGELHVTLRPTFEQPQQWGELLSEVVRRIAQAYAAAGRVQEDEVVVRIRTTFLEAPAGKSRKPAKRRPAKRLAKPKRQTKKRARR